MTDNTIQPLLAQLVERRNLLPEDAARAFQIIMSGGATPAQMAAFMVALRMKGETPDEIAAGAEVLRVKAARFAAPADCMDCCGTGGDSRGTLNVSTAVALVLAACGVKVAKHGNRAVSSHCGSADVLEASGVKIDAEPAVMERCLNELNICFLLAPRYHTAMRHVAPIRQELALRSVFNLLGPLSNPAKPTRQLLGVYSDAWLEPMAHTLHRLGVTHAWVVHGAEGLDELSPAGPSHVAQLENGQVTRFTIVPEDAGLAPASLLDMKGSDAKHNAQALHSLLTGRADAYRTAVVLNTAAGLMVAGKATDLKHGAALATQALDEGLALRTLRHFMSMSQERAA